MRYVVKILLFGDFNYTGIDWVTNSCKSSTSAEARLFLIVSMTDA